MLTAEIHDAPLPRVLAEIGKLAGFRFVQVADFDDFPPINSNFEKLPLQIAVERLGALTVRSPSVAQLARLLGHSRTAGRAHVQEALTGQGDIGVPHRVEVDAPLLRGLATRLGCCGLVNLERGFGFVLDVDQIGALCARADRDPAPPEEGPP